jgi:hypothetical protein
VPLTLRVRKRARRWTLSWWLCTRSSLLRFRRVQLPSAASSHDDDVSANALSKIATISWRPLLDRHDDFDPPVSCASSGRRCEKTSTSSPISNPQRRCAQVPADDRTDAMFSLIPGTPGRHVDRARDDLDLRSCWDAV